MLNSNPLITFDFTQSFESAAGQLIVNKNDQLEIIPFHTLDKVISAIEREMVFNVHWSESEWTCFYCRILDDPAGVKLKIKTAGTCAETEGEKTYSESETVLLKLNDEVYFAFLEMSTIDQSTSVSR